MLHVIDGILEPQQWLPLTKAANQINENNNASSAQARLLRNEPLDIIATLKQFDKFDGFVTLAEGTGLDELLKQQGKFKLSPLSLLRKPRLLALKWCVALRCVVWKY